VVRAQGSKITEGNSTLIYTDFVHG